VTETAAMLEAVGLSKKYRGRAVVEDASIEVKRGEVVGLLGPNGAGKTTCFQMISGLLASDSGKILLEGTDVTSFPMHERARLGLGYLPQEASVFRDLTVAENVACVLELRKDLDRDGRARGLERLLDEFKVAHLAESRGKSLSGGERRRVEIARALAADPAYVLLDEPFAGVDPIAVLEVQSIVRHLKDTHNIGILITDHTVRETLGICDHAAILDRGRVLARGTPEEICENPEVRTTYLGEDFRL
jgi:lipopolysaccharide export system ATP-binding protein